jgi:hypothetical protein
MSEYYTNAKHEEISFKPLKSPYNGLEETFIPFLTKLVLRHQSAVWVAANCITSDGENIQSYCELDTN